MWPRLKHRWDSYRERLLCEHHACTRLPLEGRAPKPNKAVSFLPLGAGVSPFQNPELAEEDPEGLQGLGVTSLYVVKKEKPGYSLARVPFHTLGTSGTIAHPATLW